MDASGKLSNFIADMPPTPERMRMLPPKFPIPDHVPSAPLAARPDKNDRQDRQTRPGRKAGPEAFVHRIAAGPASPPRPAS